MLTLVLTHDTPPQAGNVARAGWYLDVKTITVYYVFFFFFPVGDLDERDTVKPDGKVCVGREGPSFSIFFFFFGRLPP